MIHICSTQFFHNNYSYVQHWIFFFNFSSYFTSFLLFFFVFYYLFFFDNISYLNFILAGIMWRIQFKYTFRKKLWNGEHFFMFNVLHLYNYFYFLAKWIFDQFKMSSFTFLFTFHRRFTCIPHVRIDIFVYYTQFCCCGNCFCIFNHTIWSIFMYYSGVYENFCKWDPHTYTFCCYFHLKILTEVFALLATNIKECITVI